MGNFQEASSIWKDQAQRENALLLTKRGALNGMGLVMLTWKLQSFKTPVFTEMQNKYKIAI